MSETLKSSGSGAESSILESDHFGASVEATNSGRQGAYRRISVVAAAAVPALLYVLFVISDGVNVPRGDDWGVISLVDLTEHGRLTLGPLWSQWADTHPFVPRFFFLIFGLFDHLDEKAIMVFSAFVLIASFIVLLALFRSYVGRPLTFLPVFCIGLVWFSLADIQSALWGSQLILYLGVLFVITTAYLLLVSRRDRDLVFAMAIVTAAAASLSFMQGFLAWPIGLVCLLWKTPWGRRTYSEAAIWISSAAITTAIYFHGYAFNNTACVQEGGARSTCTFSYGLSHPVALVRFYVLLVGNVVPTSYSRLQPRYLGLREVIGVVLCAAAIFVVVQCLREKPRMIPLPLLLIMFGMLCDLMIAASHTGQGLLAAGTNNFTMANLLLLAGIVIYGWGHVPNRQQVRRSVDRRSAFRIVGFGALMAFLVVQCIVTTDFGITNGSVLRIARLTEARVVVNLDQVPSGEQACYLKAGGAVGYRAEYARLAKLDQLGVFQSSTERHYEAEGLPTISSCDRNAPGVTR